MTKLIMKQANYVVIGTARIWLIEMTCADTINIYDLKTQL